MSSKSRFKEQWIGTDLPGVRDVDTTYMVIDLSELPQLSGDLDNLVWLQPIPDSLDASGMDSHVDLTPERLEHLRSTAPDGVPSSFWRFMGSADLRSRIPSPTDCFFDLPADWFTFPDGASILRFINDSQYCVCWYLRIAPDGEATVIASPGIESEEIEFETPLLEELPFGDDPSLEAMAVESMYTVAHSFPEFLYRFWIEGILWHRLSEDIPPTAEEEAYLSDLR